MVIFPLKIKKCGQIFDDSSDTQAMSTLAKQNISHLSV